MSVFKTAYDTTACGGLRLDDVREKVKEAILMGQVRRNEADIHEISSSNAFSNQIPAFYHPLMIDMGSDGEVIAIDARSFYRTTPGGGTALFDIQGYNFLDLRARLTRSFAGSFRGSLQAFSQIPVLVFSSLVSNAIARRLRVGITEIYTIQILSAIYYCSLFEENVNTTDAAFINKVSFQLSRTMGMSAKDIKDVAERNPIAFTNIDSLCDAIKVVCNDLRLKNLNFVTLATMLGGTWYGAQGTELVNVSLEHPPVFLAMIYTAYQDRSFRKTGLATLMERDNMKKHAQTYIGALNNLAR